MNTLDAQLLAAHEANNIASLIDLYTQAAEQSDGVEAACFYLTHAYVFALELGSTAAPILRARLEDHGREPALD